MLGNAQDTVYGDPDWAAAISQTLPGVTPIIQSSAAPGEDWVATLSRIGSALVMTQQQRDLMALQLARARAGLPPIDMSAYTGLGVNVGLSDSAKQTLLILGAVAGGVFLVTSLHKHR